MVELTDPKDRQLGQTFFYGEWPVDGPFAVMDGDEVTGVEFIAAPEERSGQGFDSIGWASRIFSRYFAEQTVKGDQVTQITGEPAPEWFAPLANWDFKRNRLPCGCSGFTLRPPLPAQMVPPPVKPWKPALLLREPARCARPSAALQLSD